jgi:hypothetical protein
LRLLLVGVPEQASSVPSMKYREFRGEHDVPGATVGRKFLSGSERIAGSSRGRSPSRRP